MNTHRYIDVLQELVSSYNKSRHRSIGMAPIDVNSGNSDNVWHKLYGKEQICQAKFRVGDKVRVSKVRQTFRKGYLPNWSEEIFEIHQVNTRGIPYVYVIKDLMGEVVHGTFYAEELQKIIPPKEFKVEKVLQERKVKGKTEYFVKWMGYPAKFNSWIKNIRDI